MRLGNPSWREAAAVDQSLPSLPLHQARGEGVARGWQEQSWRRDLWIYRVKLDAPEVPSGGERGSSKAFESRVWRVSQEGLKAQDGC